MHSAARNWPGGWIVGTVKFDLDYDGQDAEWHRTEVEHIELDTEHRSDLLD